MLRNAFFVRALLLAGFLVLPACSDEVPEEPVVKLPPREHTWVRKETVKKTKEDFFAKQEETPAIIPVNEALMKRLNQALPSGGGVVAKDRESCLSLLKPLDKKRTAVQKEGGAWHAFERSPEVRPFSEHGMQIDSTINQMISALRHLCNTAKGLPQDNISRVISKKVTEQGKDAVAKELKELGDAEADIKIWLDHAAYWKENEIRDLDYKSINSLLVRVNPLIEFYEELAKRQVDESTKQAFLSDAVTLLEAMKTLFSTDEYMVLALNEDKDAPYDNFAPDL